jgi:putative flippase GtrA
MDGSLFVAVCVAVINNIMLNDTFIFKTHIREYVQSKKENITPNLLDCI